MVHTFWFTYSAAVVAHFRMRGDGRDSCRCPRLRNTWIFFCFYFITHGSRLVTTGIYIGTRVSGCQMLYEPLTSPGRDFSTFQPGPPTSLTSPGWASTRNITSTTFLPHFRNQYSWHNCRINWRQQNGNESIRETWRRVAEQRSGFIVREWIGMTHELAPRHGMAWQGSSPTVDELFFRSRWVEHKNILRSSSD